MHILAHKLAQVSRIAYLPNNIAKHEFRQLGYTQQHYIDNLGAQCYIIWNKIEVVIAFRGTEPDKWNDIKADLRAWLVPSPCGRIHKGFDIELTKLWPEINNKLAFILRKKKLYITGHSLGGAVATLCASRMMHHPSAAVDFLCTFGSPRVGNRKQVNSITTTHHRYVNNNDVVTSVPPALLTYKHHGEMKYINHYGNVRDLTLWQRIKDQFRGRLAALKKKVPFDGVYDHDIKYYIRYTSDTTD